MERDPDTGQTTKNATEARAGVKLGAMRYVLAIGIALAILFMFGARAFGLW